MSPGKQRPVSFAPHVEAAPIPGLGLVVSGERGVEAYDGDVYAVLGARITGSRDRDALVATFPAGERPAAERALGVLLDARVVTAGPSTVDDEPAAEEAGWWASAGLASHDATRRLADASAQVIAVGDTDPRPLREHLARARIVEGAKPALSIVLVDDYLEEELAELNDAALGAGRPWLLARPTRAVQLIGPVFTPDAGPCWACLAQRLRLHRQLLGHPGVPLTAAGALGPRLPDHFAAGAAALIAGEAQRWLAGATAALATTVISLDLRSFESHRHHVVWRPQCPACGWGGDPVPAAAAAIQLDRDASLGGSELRVVDPAATLKRYDHHISPLTGAVGMLHRRPGPELLHAYISGGPAATVHGDHSRWAAWAGQPSAGKGTSDAGARAGALCEALERYSGRRFGDEPVRVATAEELGVTAVVPNAVMNFSERQFEQREQLNARPSTTPKTWIPERHDPKAPATWAPAWSLTAGAERWIPVGLCYYQASLTEQPDCVADSNGNAAGNSLEEAILHGALELIERDHVALWWYNRLRLPAVNLDTVPEPWLAAVREHLAAEHRELWVLDLTADLGIPVAAAVSRGEDNGIGVGFGAHLDLAGATTRAVTELVQLGLGATSGGLGHGPAGLNGKLSPFLEPDPDTPPSDAGRATARGPSAAAGDDAAVSAGSGRGALAQVQAAVEARGLELIVLDQTRPDIGLPVAKAIVPGLRHFWPRFGPGRLYDVPVALRWLAASLDEEQLNPEPPVS